jgi:hypothetical protein
MKSKIIIVLSSYLKSSCSAIKETSKHLMESGIYKAKSGNNHSYYTVVDEDKIALHPVTKTEEG